MTRSSIRELIEPYNEPERVLHSLRKLFKTTSFNHWSSPKFKLYFDYKEQVEEEIFETMTKPTMEEYITKTREDYGSGIARPKFDKDTKFELKGQFLKELCDNTFSGSENENANEHIERVLEVVDLFTIADVTQDQLMLRVFPISLTGAAINERVYAVQVGCEFCNGPHYSKDCALKEKGKTLEEAYYSQFGVPFLNARRYRVDALGFYQRDNGNPSYQERRQTMEQSLSKFLAKSTKRHDENSSLIKEIRASTDATIRNQGASIKALEIQIGQMSKVLQEKGSGSLPSSIETNLRDHVKSISTTNAVDIPSVRHIKPIRYAVSSQQKDEKMQSSKLSRASVPFPGPLADLGASISVMPYSTFTHLGLCKLAPTNLIIELVNKTVKRPKGIVENMLVRIDRSQDPEYRDFLEVNDLNEPLELRNHDNEDLDPEIEEGEIVDEPMVDIVKIKVAVAEARRFDRFITIGDGNNSVTNRMARSHPRFKHLSKEQYNNIRPVLQVSAQDKLDGILHPYQKLKVSIKES
ncbi:hypothetical protein Tco_0972652 [Tanacetum coccineum]